MVAFVLALGRFVPEAAEIGHRELAKIGDLLRIPFEIRIAVDRGQSGLEPSPCVLIVRECEVDQAAFLALAHQPGALELLDVQ